LSPDVVGGKLLDYINSDSWQSRTKALIVVAQLAKTRGCEMHAQWWASNAVEEISGMASDPKPSVRTQALKTMKALKISASSSGSGVSNRGATNEDDTADNMNDLPPPPPTPTTSVSLLDTDDYSAPNDVSSVSTASVQQNYSGAATTSSSNDLFAGMAVGTTSNDISASAAEISSPAKAQPAQNSLLDLLAGDEEEIKASPAPSLPVSPSLTQSSIASTTQGASIGLDFLMQPSTANAQQSMASGPTSTADSSVAQLLAQNSLLQQQLQMQQYQMQQINMMMV
jgi:hypothetical protein